MEELCTIAVTRHDAKPDSVRWPRAASVDEGLRILDRLDAALGAGDQGGVKPTHPFPHHPGRRRPQRFGRTR